MFQARAAMGMVLAGLAAHAPSTARSQVPGELANCYVERVPCGTPAQLAETLRRCIASPALCGASRPPLPVATSARGAPEAEPRGKGPSPAPPPSGRTIGSGLLETVARGLDLPGEIGTLNNQAPANATEVMRRLGLTPSSAPATDFRGREPSVEELVLALLP